MAQSKPLCPFPSSSSSEGGEEEEPINEPLTPNPNPNPNPNRNPRDDASDSKEDDDSESDEDNEEAPRNKKRKSSAMEICKAGDKRTKPNVPENSKKNKERIEEDSEKSEKGKSTHNYFQRIWSLEDEIAILRGIREYRKKMGISQLSGQNLVSFHKFVAPSLSITATVSQLSEKIRRLKGKYRAAAARINSGKEPRFLGSHDQRVYELSKKIWDGDNEGKIKSSHKKNTSVVALKDRVAPCRGGEVVNLSGPYPCLSRAVISAFDEMDVATLMVLEEKFKKQKLAEKKLLWNKSLKLIMKVVNKTT